MKADYLYQEHIKVKSTSPVPGKINSIKLMKLNHSTYKNVLIASSINIHKYTFYYVRS